MTHETHDTNNHNQMDMAQKEHHFSYTVHKNSYDKIYSFLSQKNLDPASLKREENVIFPDIDTSSQ